MNKLILFLPMLVGITFCTAQTEPVRFEPSFISDGGVFGLTVSPDSKTALWVKSNGKRDTLKIMESVKIDGKWSAPKVSSFSTYTGRWKDIDPVFSPDGNMVLFQSTRPVPGMPNRKGFDIWAVKKQSTGWGEPYHLGNVINTDISESYASISDNGNIYFMKENENKQGNSDIYVSKLEEGVYQKPVNLGSPVNTIKYRESNPFISAKEDFIIYFSSDSSGFGDVDLFISFRNKDEWSTPRNLGIPINSEFAEFCPFVHANEKRLYFSRQQKQSENMVEDLYYIPFDADAYRMSR